MTIPPVVRWIGQRGEVVDTLSVIKDGHRRSIYRLRQYGYWVADCQTVEELAEHVDLATLREE